MTNKSILKLNDAYIKAENNLMNAIRKLENCGGECDCDDTDVVSFAEGDCNEGRWVESFCLNCGGNIIN